jgi:hypothetical protein
MLDDPPRASQATRSPKKRRIATKKGSSAKRVKFTGLTPHSKYPNMSLRVVPDAHSCVSRLVGSARPHPCVARNPWNPSEFVGWGRGCFVLKRSFTKLATADAHTDTEEERALATE